MITNHQADVLEHASSNGRYVTDEESVLEMAHLGLLNDFGPQRLAGGAHYLTTSVKGRKAMMEWRAAQPKPKKPKRRCSEQFRSWRNYCEANGHFGFSDFLKTVWPNRIEYL